MNDGVQSFDPDYGWERAVPTPFWSRSWRTLYRWRATCPEHGIDFGNSVKGGDAWREHYMREHLAGLAIEPGSEELSQSDWWRCPNQPRCPHAAIFHDIMEMDDPMPRCCADGCDCGKRVEP